MRRSSISGRAPIRSCPQLKGCRCRQISIETAQSNLDCAVLKELPDQTIILGVLDLSTPEIETPETVAARIRRALVHRKPEDIIVAPDCGLKYLPRDAAFGKMKAMVEGARIVRSGTGERVSGAGRCEATPQETRSHLRTHLPLGIFGAEHVIVEVGDPLAARGGQARYFMPSSM